MLSKLNRLRVWAGLVALLVGTVRSDAGSIAETEQDRAAQRPPNIIFILADDLGYGDLGCYGQKQIQTPHLDRMAAEGMRFTDFYAGSTVCAPSRCVLMTGLHTGHCYIRGNAKTNLRPTDQTVAKLLQKAGYTTGLVGKWGLGHEGSSGVPTHQGFDYFFGYLDQHHAHNYYPTFLMRNETRVPLGNVVPGPGDFGHGVASEKVQYSHDLLAAESLDFITRSRDKPFFLYLALTIPHANNEAKDKGMEVPDYGIYQDKDWPDAEKGHAAMITRMDRDIGRLFARLKELGIDEQTVVLFSSDNGPHREGGHNPDYFDSNGPLRGIKRDLYEGGIRVPMLVRWPGHVPADSVSHHAGSFADFFATAAELAGVSQTDKTDGISFARAMRGHADQPTHEFLYWEFYEGRGGAQAVRMGDWKGVRTPAFSGPVQLYHLPTDLGEQRNVADERADLAAQVLDRMNRSHVPSSLWRVAGQGTPKAKSTKNQ